jgi:hypothetical protein
LAATTRRLYIEGRTLALEFGLLQEDLLDPTSFVTKAGATRAISSQLNQIKEWQSRTEATLAQPQNFTSAALSKARALKFALDQQVQNYENVLTALERGPAGDRPDPSEFRR